MDLPFFLFCGLSLVVMIGGSWRVLRYPELFFGEHATSRTKFIDPDSFAFIGFLGAICWAVLLPINFLLKFLIPSSPFRFEIAGMIGLSVAFWVTLKMAKRYTR